MVRIIDPTSHRLLHGGITLKIKSYSDLSLTVHGFSAYMDEIRIFA